MKQSWIAWAAAAAVLSACAREQAKVNAVVDPRSVGTVLIASGAAEQSSCASAVRARGATVLFESPRGLILTDRKLHASELAGCEAVVAPNSELSLPAPARTETGDSRSLQSLLELLPAEEIGARSFVRNHPDYDGRGVVVAVLDTGVQVDHPMLRRTPDGRPKVVGSFDFSGEGHVPLTPITLTEGAFETAEGKRYTFEETGVTDPRFGVFRGSTLSHSEDVAKADKFADVGVLVYRNADGKWIGRIDLDNDREFGEEEELSDFGESGKFVRLGEKGTLTTNLNVSEDGASASLVFDDGSHGTHVAGIAAGYDPAGLQGVAPGAQVLGLKIGDSRLSGGSTTTASMLMAIDFAASRGADVINLSYGIRAGSNIGKSAIDAYVDKIAREKGVLFSISAGNEGPGLMTVGTPAGAELALTNAAFLSKETARHNYGYVNFARDRAWYFSSVGPLFDGGLKPTLLAPGTALSSVPPWGQGHATYSGTSMASPQVTGGLALILSAAKQESLPVDRATVTRAVYLSAKKNADLMLIEQGHGLMNVPAAHETLRELAGEGITVEYKVSVRGGQAPGGTGGGIYVRGDQAPTNLFTVTIAPSFPDKTPETEKHRLRTYRLEPSQPWIMAPRVFYLTGGARAFRADIDSEIFARPGLYSEFITGVDEATNRPAFVVPVTVVVPEALERGRTLRREAEVEVGETHRMFLNVPAGTTSLKVDLVSDGPMIWGQLLDPEGRLVADLNDGDAHSPQAPLGAQANLLRPGVYELDIVAPGYNQRTAAVSVRVTPFSLTVRQGPQSAPGVFNLIVENGGAPARLSHELELFAGQSSRFVSLEKTDRVEIPFTLSEDDKKNLKEIAFRVRTAKSVYDRMTDYPYFVLNPKGELVTAGGLQLDSTIHVGGLGKLNPGEYRLVVIGAFTKDIPERWGFELSEQRVLAKDVTVVSAGAAGVLDRGQFLVVPVDLSKQGDPVVAGMENCFRLRLSAPGMGTVQTHEFCQ